MPYVVNRWLGGTLTNFKTIKRRTQRLKSLEKQKEEGAFSKYTKKEALLLDREIKKLNELFAGIKDMDRLPNILFVVDTMRDNIAIKEAKSMHIPVVAIVDTNADPTEIQYPISANDDAQKSLSLLLNLVADVVKEASAK
jgi:small subunit ribosomal protein S2